MTCLLRSPVILGGHEVRVPSKLCRVPRSCETLAGLGKLCSAHTHEGAYCGDRNVQLRLMQHHSLRIDMLSRWDLAGSP